MNITITNTNINRLKKLFSIIPDTFSHVPLKIGKDENGNCFARIDSTDINGDVSFYGNVELDDIKELEPSSMMIIRLQTNRAVLSTLFNSVYDSIQINKTRILVQTKNKKMSIQLYQLLEKDIYELPETNVDMYEAVISNNIGLKNDGFFILDLDKDEMKDFIDSSNILTPNKTEDLRFNIKTNKDRLVVYSEDYIKNNFEYTFTPILADKIKIDTKYDYNLVDVMSKILKFKDYDISTLISNPVVSFTITSEKEGITSTISVPAQKD